MAVVSSRDGSLKSALPALLALLGVPDPRWDALDPVERRHQTLDAVEQLLVVESRARPLLIVFEDIHWSDPESQAFLDALVAALPAARILLLVTYRPEKRHSWSNLTYYTQLNLAPLPSEAAHQLLTDLLGPDPSLDPVKQQLIEWTNGYPFFLEEWVQTLVETRVLEGRRGTYRATRMASVGEVPATIEDVLATRIERLGLEDKTLIQSAAAIGAEVPVAVLSAVVDLSYDALRSGMRRLQAAELLYENTTEMGRGFAFKHALTRDDAPDGTLVQSRYEEAMARAGESGMRPLVAHCQFGLGSYHARRGDHIAAETYFGRAAAGFRVLDMPWPGR